MKKKNNAEKILSRTLTALISLSLLFSLPSCVSESPEGDSGTQSRETATESESGVEKRPTGEVDADAKKVEGIAISSAEELPKIGRDKKYPLDGDYVLVADIDLSDYGTFTPIGGYVSECGIVEGDNVFTGTFDGRGHTIYALSIDVSSPERVHVGLFGSVGSKYKEDPAVIKNLILKNVSVKGSAGGPATYAALAGQVDGYASLDNIALICGRVEVKVGGGDILGISSLIGQCRTQDWTGCSNNGISITNIFTNLEVIGENNGHSNYTSGLIGRIRGSDLGTLSNVLQIGSVTHEGDKGNAIAAGDSHAKVNQNVYYRAGCAVDNNYNGKTKSSRSLVSGEIELDPACWSVNEGSYPMLKSMLESSLYSELDFVTLTFENGDSAEKVTSSFTLPTEIFGNEISWSSGSAGVIAISGDRAEVKKPPSGQVRVTLTAYLGGAARSFSVNVDSGVVGRIAYDGESTLTAKSYPAGTSFTWSVFSVTNGKAVGSPVSGDTFALDSSMLNSIVALSADGFDDVHFYYSAIPSVSIESDTAYYDVSKGGYSDAVISVYPASGYPETSYSGKTQIKLRGNSTAYQAKRPFKLKLEKKSNLFGMGESKHWVLLANAFDRTNLRNKLSYDFGAELGLVSCESILVNVIYNGEYYGLYQLCENIRIDEGRVDILDWEEVAEDVAEAIARKEKLPISEQTALENKLTSNLSWITSGKFGSYTISDYYDTSAFDISGGYLIENDAYYDEYSKFVTKNDMKMMVQSPEFLSTNDEMFKYLKNYLQDMEDAIYSPNRLNSEGKHYSEYMDVDSFVDFWMVNQVFKNVELLFKSCYMYKDVGKKLTFGPIWDMDWAAGNHVNLHGYGGKYDTWWHSESQDREYWYRALYNDPYFVLCLYERWQEIQGSLDNIFTSLDSIYSEIEVSAEIDNRRWGYDWTYEMEVSEFREWMQNRRAWMDGKLKTPETLLKSFGYFNPSKSIEIASVTETDGGIELEITADARFVSFDLIINGVLTREEQLSSQPTGESTGKISISSDELRAAGEYNSIEVLAKDASGEYNVIKKRSGQNGSNGVDADYIYYISK